MGNKLSFSPGFTKEDYRRLLANGIPIEGRRVGPASLFIEIQSGRPGKSPFFSIGTVMLKLIHPIAEGHPIYCVPASWFLLSNPKLYIADTAAFLAREILSIAPDGPCLLGGYCFTGWMSYEIARVLKSSKKNVDLLLFIDDRAPHRRLRSSIQLIKQIVTRAGRPFSGRKETAETFVGKFIEGSDNPVNEKNSSILAVRGAAANYYKDGRRRYDGNIDIFLSDNGSRIKNFLDRMDWKGLIRGKSRITFIPGSHDWTNPTQLEKIRQILSQRLVDAQNMADGRLKTKLPE